jgi:hypothetical protein
MVQELCALLSVVQSANRRGLRAPGSEYPVDLAQDRRRHSDRPPSHAGEVLTTWEGGRSFGDVESAISALVVVAVCGGLLAFLLGMKNSVKRRLARGEKVNSFVGAYVGMGIWSLLLWCPIVFFLGIVLIMLTH